MQASAWSGRRAAAAAGWRCPPARPLARSHVDPSHAFESGRRVFLPRGGSGWLSSRLFGSRTCSAVTGRQAIACDRIHSFPALRRRSTPKAIGSDRGSSLPVPIAWFPGVRTVSPAGRLDSARRSARRQLPEREWPQRVIPDSKCDRVDGAQAADGDARASAETTVSTDRTYRSCPS